MKRLFLAVPLCALLAAGGLSWAAVANAAPVTYSWEGGELHWLVPAPSETIAVAGERLNYDIHPEDTPGKGLFAEVRADYRLENRAQVSQTLDLAFAASNPRSTPAIRHNGQPLKPLAQLSVPWREKPRSPQNPERWTEFSAWRSRVRELSAYAGGAPVPADAEGDGRMHLVLFQVELAPGPSRLEVSYQEQAAHQHISGGEGPKEGWEFYYFLQPAAYFQSFGTLEIQVDLPSGGYTLEPSLGGFTQQGSRYTASFAQLPQENLRLVVLPPQPQGPPFAALWGGGAALGGLLLYLGMRKRKKLADGQP